VNIEEQRLIENSLTELRFRFVQAMESRKEAPESPAPEPLKPDPPQPEPPSEEQAGAGVLDSK
jgi:hypothetical protein